MKPIKPKPSRSNGIKGGENLMEEEEEIEEEEGEGNSYGRKMPIRQVMLELERDGIIEIYEDKWGKVQIRITGGWS